MQIVFSTLSILLSVYTFLCFIRIILTWIPGLAYSRFTYFLARITDPYLNLFRGIKWLRLGSFDFTPAVGFCLLSVASTLLAQFSRMGHFTAGSILAMAVRMFWSMISSIITFIIILFLVRFIIILIRKDSYYSGSYIMEQIDHSIAPLAHNISKVFTGGRKITYKTALIISAAALFLLQLAGGFLFNWIASLLIRLPL